MNAAGGTGDVASSGDDACQVFTHLNRKPTSSMSDDLVGSYPDLMQPDWNLRRIFNKRNHLDGGKASSEFELMIIHMLCEPLPARDDDGTFTGAECEHYRSDPRVGDDDPGSLDVLFEPLEWKGRETGRTRRPDAGWPALYDHILTERDFGEG